MEKKSQKIIVIIVIGILFSIISYIYFKYVDNFFEIQYSSGDMLNLKLFNNPGINKNVYFLVAIFLNVATVLNLYIMNEDKLFLKPILFLISTSFLYFSIYLFIYLLTFLTSYLSFLNPIFLIIAYALFMKFNYKLRVGKFIVIGIGIFFVVSLIMNHYENFRYFDFVWFLLITTIFPFFVKKK